MGKDKPRKGKDIYFREIEDEGIVYQPQENVVHSLNSTALLIWKLCDGAHTREDMAEEISSVYKVGREQAFRDIESVLGRLEELGLLEN